MKTIALRPPNDPAVEGQPRQGHRHQQGVVTAGLLGRMTFSAEQGETISEMLDLPAEAVTQLQVAPCKSPPPTSAPPTR